ncbi:MAG: AbrB/MazE/SpoVT family DNA-binding domain-containing protein [Candidatus Saccharimonadales bacterium]
MTTITTKLVKDGNSMAVRLPKQVLAMSGLTGVVQLDVRRGAIILRTPTKARPGWRQQIEREIAAHGQPATIDDYGDLRAEIEATLKDGLT